MNYRMLLVIFLAVTLSGCGLFQIYKRDIEQGNIITEEKVAQLKDGMSASEIKYIMGTPMVVNIFDTNQIDYVYTFTKGNQRMAEKKVILHLKNNRLVGFERTGV